MMPAFQIILSELCFTGTFSIEMTFFSQVSILKVVDFSALMKTVLF